MSLDDVESPPQSEGEPGEESSRSRAKRHISTSSSPSVIRFTLTEFA